ncbi:hypothetical protein B0H63DRAFT_137312 [Podospora didyma]|uniref:Adenine deaminase n=1 Tax=Podospora didyma TaxID=330526 RepID=A0AAE0U0K9_9PEZI|nr:hypothetical protein B0H63DRAFT_137312 [Podospora didyma]
MCKSPLHALLTSMPKCEHHLHLEGTLSCELLFSLAEANTIPLPSGPEFASPAALRARYAAFTSLDDFLAYYYIGFSVLLTASDFEQLTYAYLSRAAHENVRHAEIFFDPQGHTSRGVSVSAIVEGFQAAAKRAAQEFRITALLIPCLLRHLPVADSKACFESLVAAGHFDARKGGEAEPGFAGLGLCSTELSQPPAHWAEIFAAAKSKGIRRTVHAGEEGPARYVAAALADLGAMRIDHGVRAAEDDAVIEKLAEQGVLVTVCPVSNVCLRVAKSVAESPLSVFVDKGVKFSLNSDDPAYFGDHYIQDVYCAVEEAFGFSIEQWAKIVRDAVDGSWCTEERKAVIREEIDGGYCYGKLQGILRAF